MLKLLNLGDKSLHLSPCWKELIGEAMSKLHIKVRSFAVA
jgi:hypothetical protein